MAEEASADHGYVVPDNSWAMFWNEANGYRLLTPPLDLPIEAMALVGCFVRLDQDPTWRKEMADWFLSQPRS